MAKINNIPSNEVPVVEKYFTTQEVENLVEKYKLKVTTEKIQIELNNLIQNKQNYVLEKIFNRRESQKILSSLFKQIKSLLFTVIDIKRYKEKNLIAKTNRYTFLPDYDFYKNCIEKNQLIKQRIKAYLLEYESLRKEKSLTRDMEATVCFWSRIDLFLEKEPLDDSTQKSINALWKEHVFSLLFIYINKLEESITNLMDHMCLLTQHKMPRTSIYKTKKLAECERACESLRFLYAYYFYPNSTFNNVCNVFIMIGDNIGRNNNENFYDKQQSKGRLLDFI